MPPLDPAWWAARLPQLTAIVVATATGAGAAVLLKRWLLGLEHERVADEQRLRAERMAEKGAATASADPVRPPRVAFWVTLLPWAIGIVGAFGLVDALEVIVLDEVVRALREAAAFELFSVGGVPVTPAALLLALFTLAVARWISSWAQRAAGRALRAGGDQREGVVASVQRLVHYGVMTLAALAVLREVGVDISTLFAAGAVFAVGIGFGLQSLTTNFVSGLILLLERTVKPGDVVLVDGRMVKITELGTRATIGRTLDDDEVILPNGKLLDGFVVNYSLHSEVVRARAQVGVSYGSDVDKVIRVLTECAKAFPQRVKRRPPVVLFRDFGSSSLDFEVSIWIDDPFQRDTILSGLRVAIWRALKDNGIEIPFPQVDVHFDRAGLEALASR